MTAAALALALLSMPDAKFYALTYHANMVKLGIWSKTLNTGQAAWLESAIGKRSAKIQFGSKKSERVVVKYTSVTAKNSSLVLCAMRESMLGSDARITNYTNLVSPKKYEIGHCGAPTDCLLPNMPKWQKSKVIVAQFAEKESTRYATAKRFLSLSTMTIRLARYAGCSVPVAIPQLASLDTVLNFLPERRPTLRLPDAEYLRRRSEHAGVSVVISLAVAWEETRSNTNPSVRGVHGEIGRYQIKQSTAHAFCPGLDITVYWANVECFLRIIKTLQQRYDIPGLLPINAITKYNGSGPMARAYTERVMRSVDALR